MSPAAKPKLLHIVRSFAMAGAEKHIFMTLAELARRRYDVTLLTLTDKGLGKYTEGYGNELGQLRSLGVHVQEDAVRGKKDFRAVLQIRDVVSELKPDIVHTHMPFSDLFGGVGARLASAPIVLSSRHYDYSHSQSALWKAGLYYRGARPFHDAVIAISSRVAELCRKAEGWRSDDVHTVLYGCEDQRVNKTDARERVRREMGVERDDFLIGTVARLVDWKGHRYALEALATLRRRGRAVTWLFIGDGPERQALEARAQELSLGSAIRFLGHRTDIPDLMAALDTMVHPAIAEGFGLIFLEAMMQGTAVVGARTGAIPEIIADGETGLLVRPGRSGDLVDAVERFVQDRGWMVRLGDAGRTRFETDFSLGRMVDQIETVYRRLLVGSG